METANCNKRVRFDKGDSEIASGSGISSVSSIQIKHDVIKVQDNPHLQQACTSLLRITDEMELFRVMSKEYPRLIYRRRRGEMKSLKHRGQRKLMICEIEFLTMYGGNGATCVYAGSAPGNHINYLSVMFPHIYFVLIDPSEFGCFEDPGYVSIRQERMTDEIASEIRGKVDGDLLFISDIRSADWRTVGNEQLDDEIYQDMQMQQKWHELLEAKASMLKFRLPWQPGTTEYLNGRVYFPIWAPVTSTESRLVVTAQSSVCVWNHQEYWEKMHYFNTVARASAYRHILGIRRSSDGSVRIDHCYDCAAEVKVLKEYIEYSRALAGGGISSLWIGEDEVLPAENSFSGDGTLNEMSLADAIIIIADRIDSACCVGRAMSGGRPMIDSQLPFAFSSSRRRCKTAKRIRGSGHNEDSQLQSWRSPSLHITSKTSFEVLQNLFECRCSPQQKSEASSRCLWAVCVRDPDMTDLPYTDTGAWSSLGVGCEVPEGSALDMWLWGVLLLGDKRIEDQYAVRSVAGNFDLGSQSCTEPALTLSTGEKTKLLHDLLEDSAIDDVCDALDAKGYRQYNRIVAFFGQVGYVYLYYLDSSGRLLANSEACVARINVASGFNRDNFGICVGVVVRRQEDGLLSIILSLVLSWWRTSGEDDQPPTQIWNSTSTSDSTCQTCPICSTVLNGLDTTSFQKNAMWNSVGIVSIACGRCDEVCK